MVRTNAQHRARRTGGRSARVRAAVLDATVEALLAQGIDDFSIHDVAERAGVHETSIYRRWENRAGLALDAVLSRTDAEVPVPDTGHLRGDLLDLLRNITAFCAAPLGQLLLRMAVRDDLPEFVPAREHFFNARLAAGETVLRRAQARGELRPGIDRRLALETLVASLGIRLLFTRTPPDDAFYEHLADIVLTGIASRPASG
jgi:AcrR family transcriptional regulator